MDKRAKTDDLQKADRVTLIGAIMLLLCRNYEKFPPGSLHLQIGLYKLDKTELRVLYQLLCNI